MAKLKGNAAGVYNAGGQTLTDGAETGFFFDSTGALLTNATFTAGDIEIGAVEIKDGTTDTRAVVSASGLLVAGGKTNNNAAPGATNFGVLGAIANAAAPTWTEGFQVLGSVDLSGNQRTTLGTLLAGEDLIVGVIKVEERFSYAHVAAGQATTIIKSGAGFLHSITFNSAATATNVTTVYDNTAGSGTVIAIPAATTATVPTTLMYDVLFATGLTIVTATANSSDMTISYR